MLDCCNMGYSAGKCPCFPAGSADSVRFAIASDTGAALQLHWVRERDHLPTAHGRVEYRRDTRQFFPPLESETLAAQARAYVTSYLKRARSVGR
jgi:hypothetical protein